MSTFWSLEEESLLEECFIQISQNPDTSADQQMNTFWDKVLDAYNKEANKRNYHIRNKNMLRGKWPSLARKIRDRANIPNDN